MGTKWGQGQKTICVVCSKSFTSSGHRATCGPECRDERKALRNIISKNKHRPDRYSIHVTGYVLISGSSVRELLGKTRSYHHVFVAYSQCGDGPHQCYWCDHPIDWYFGQRTGTKEIRKLVVDHLNWVKIDNRSENLVLSCMKCNLDRGKDGLSQRERTIQSTSEYHAMNPDFAKNNVVLSNATRSVRCTGCDGAWSNFHGYRGHRIKCKSGALEYT